MTTVYTLDPLQDPRWPEFLQRHPGASVFHTWSWLEALHRTYGYAPTVISTSSSGEELKNGIVYCRVKGWLSDCRMVSMPFSDHCQPLVDSEEDFNLLFGALRQNQERERSKYIELRPLPSWNAAERSQSSLSTGEQFFFHTLDLRPSLDTIFHNFHKSCLQRKIRRAEREDLGYEAGWSESILTKFYDLLLLTRRRHQLPPQPLAWFRNLADCFGDRLAIRIVSKGGQPIASILTLSFRSSLVYKYGCSDAKFHNLGGMPFLFWRAIKEARERGAQEFDLGRSDIDNPGLVTFKDHLGAACSKLCYLRAFRNGSRIVTAAGREDWRVRLAKGAISHMPDSFLKIAGNLLYKHAG